MDENRRKQFQDRVKKLALAFETGWAYLPESEEAGSVLTDIFLDMELKNAERLERVWERQKLAFLDAVPGRRQEQRRLETALCIKSPEEGDGRRLESGTRVYALTEQGELIRFMTTAPLVLTAARLSVVIYRRGLSAWLRYLEGDDASMDLSYKERVLSYPVFRWRFKGLWDGHKSFAFELEFRECPDLGVELPGSWTISDGRNSCPAIWQQSEKAVISGLCPDFAGNLEGEDYELCLELPAGDTLPTVWLKSLGAGFVLKEEAAAFDPDLSLTDDGAGGEKILPFGAEPDEASCFYLACDRAAGRAGCELILQLEESYETEEKLPEQMRKEYKKLYKKYPWMEPEREVLDWRAEETLWEYFNGKLWYALPDSGDWRTGCRPEEPGKREYRFTVPRDIEPCSVEGEEHIYLRLRPGRVRGAYAAYYRKQIPVFREIRFLTPEYRAEPMDRDIPDPDEAEENKIYLGFDRNILPENCWHTSKGCRQFTSEQIKGQGERYGKRACWVELPEGEEPEALLPNYVEIRQDAGREDEGEASLRIPEGTAFYVETGKLGTLDGVSVTEARYDRAGAPVLDEKRAAEHYFSHFGRILTVMDLELLLKERYPFFRVGRCLFNRETKELRVELWLLPSADRKEAEGRLKEAGQWISELIARDGALWLENVSVTCILRRGKERDRQDGEREAAVFG